ncbi:MAG: hypothetical protein NC209_05515 [Alistipes sp.]|nr:hypothetical protein [Alistipes senegalensis]MCM1250583.1 hypothetical protein [Alistipes sp.]
MKRTLTLLAALLALTGCRIEEGEYLDPADTAYGLFRCVNDHLAEAADDAARVMLFDLYYSASEEERKAIHDRYFYSSRIVGSGDEWCIIDNDGKLTIYTDGQPLSTAGALWRYTARGYAEHDMSTIACRTEEFRPAVFDLRLPDSGGQLSFTAAYCIWPQDDGTARYGCELKISGSGLCPDDIFGFGAIAYEIVEPLRYESHRPYGFYEGKMKLTAETAADRIEASASYLDTNVGVWLGSGQYGNTYWYR